MNYPNISAMTWDGETWGGWSNSCDPKELTSIQDAVTRVKKDPELGWRIIDADNLLIYVSDMAFAERGIKSAKVNFGVDIPIENVILGYPAG